MSYGYRGQCFFFLPLLLIMVFCLQDGFSDTEIRWKTLRFGVIFLFIFYTSGYSGEIKREFMEHIRNIKKEQKHINYFFALYLFLPLMNSCQQQHHLKFTKLCEGF
ncbi:hypothetical protein BDZ91DRAFT_719988 [Kalaharituber pfeilii]|nr:hypothetical protein BDZ91DRAFT_719988 [Kalaharituber pfeilii]